MRKGTRFIALILALVCLCASALAELFHVSDGNQERFGLLAEILEKVDAETPVDRPALEALLEEIRAESETDGEIARDVANHWIDVAMNELSPMYFLHEGEQTASELEESEPDFAPKHAFVALGYQLHNGEMTEELIGRCNAVAAAARSYPGAIIICTGGATGGNNPEGHTEAGEMKKYLSETCGIEESRIFTEEQAMTTAENAENVFGILKREGIETFTLVTSDYHQKWSQVLFNGLASVYRRVGNYQVRLAGNYSYPARHVTGRGRAAGLYQLFGLLMKGLEVY